MKKLFYFAAAAVALAACAKNEVIPVNSGENQEITFNVAPKTKANDTHGHENFEPGKVFASWAYYLPKGTDWDHKSNDPKNEKYPKEYISGATVSHDGTAWKAKKSYYWPKDGGKLTFFAYSLNKGDLTLKGEHSAFTCDPVGGISGHINMSDNSNTDFLVAEIAKDRTENVKTHFTEGVPTLFRHKLSKIVFNVKAGTYDRTSFKLKSIQFKNIGCYGVYNQEPEAFSHGHQSVPYNPYYSESEEGQEQDITSTLTNVNESSVKNWIFVPQRFEDETDIIEIIYIINTEVATDKFVTQTVTKTIKLKELFPTEHNDSTDPNKVTGGGWEMGKKYTINLTFTLDEILWDPAVEDWKDVNIGTETAPIIVG